MAGQVLPLRLLTPSRTLLSTRGAFALRLKTLTFSSNPSFLPCSIGSSGGRCFSSRAPRPRDGGMSEYRTGRAAAAGGQAKSLIEDEAELSDWVSYLKTDSFGLGLTGSDGEELDRDQKRGGKRNERDDRVRGRDSGGFSGRRTLRGSGGFSERNSRGSLSKRRVGSDLEEGGGWRGSRGSSGLRNNRGSGGFSERKPRGSPSKRRFGSDLEDEDEEEEDEKEEFLCRQRRGPGSLSNFTKRGGRNGESSYKQGRKSLLEMSDEEEGGGGDEDDDDAVYGFDDADKREKEKVGMKDSLLKSGSAADLSDGDSEKPVLTSSGGDKNSYLSNTRFDQCSISSLSLKGVKAAGYERMTLVQEATLPVILKGKDVLAKAKTGTGKTVAFFASSNRNYFKITTC